MDWKQEEPASTALHLALNLNKCIILFIIIIIITLFKYKDKVVFQWLPQKQAADGVVLHRL